MDPEQGSCALNDYPRELQEGPTVNLISGRLVACLYDTCEIFEDGSWQHLQDTTATRRLHSSASTADAVLLIGGKNIHSTEWIPVDGSAARPGPFEVMNGYRACTIQINEDVIVVTGGAYTEDFVTKYRLDNGKETPLPPLVQPRYDHACAVYDDKRGDKVKKVGFNAVMVSCCNTYETHGIILLCIWSNCSGSPGYWGVVCLPARRH